MRISDSSRQKVLGFSRIRQQSLVVTNWMLKITRALTRSKNVEIQQQQVNNNNEIHTSKCSLLFRLNLDGPKRHEKVFFKPDLVDMM